MRLYFCGVRGSTPAPGEEFVRYGGHTSCVAVASTAVDGAPLVPTLVLDSGTGVRTVTALLGDRPFIGTILLTHLHWDHVQGLPFFRGADRDDAEVSLVLPAQEDGTAAEDVVAKMMSPPHFPIRPGELRGAWSFFSAEQGPVEISERPSEEFSVEAREIPHKGGRTFGYRVTDGRATVAYLPDHCPTVLGPGRDGWGEYHEAALELAADVDVLIHDAQLLSHELAAEAYFGHAAANYAVELGHLAGARKVLLFHHRPERTDDELDLLGEQFADAKLEVVVASQDMVLDL